jgi:hypothetical protein
MSYEVIGYTNSLGQFASNSGYRDLIAAAAGCPALDRLFETGESSNVPAVIRALNKITSPSATQKSDEWIPVSDLSSMFQ